MRTVPSRLHDTKGAIIPPHALLFLCSLAAAAAAFLAGRRSVLGDSHRQMLRSRAMLVQAEQLAHVGSWEVDMIANRVTWSDETYRIMGFVPQSQPATLALFQNHVHPDDLDFVMRSIADATRTGTFEFGFRVVRPDGTIRHVLDRGRATVRDGVLVRVLGTTQDLTEQKAVERALELARAHQAALLDNLPDLIFLKDRDSKFVAVNEPLARILGAPREEIIGKTDFDFFRAEQAQSYLVDDEMAIASGERMVVEQQVPGAGGTLSWIETTTSPYRDASGEYAGIVGITRDVTVPHEAAERLRESARHYQLLFDRNPLPMWVFDVETLRFLAVNEAATAHYGYDREQFLTMSIDDIRPAEEADALHASLDRSIDCHTIAGPFVHLTRDGRRIETEVIADSIIMNGRPARLVLARDVSLERSSVRALQASEERYRALFVESLAGNYVSTADGRLLACNPTFARMMGYDDPADACTHATEDFFPEPDMRQHFLTLLRKQRRLELHEDVLKRRDGSLIQILENVIGHFDDGGALTEIHGFVIDVTDRKRLEEQLRHSQKLQAVGQLAGGIAHDFNNLLTAMKLHGEFVLEEMAESDPHRADVLEMQLAADRATMLTRQLLAFSRKQLLNPKVIDANTVVEGMAPMVQRLIGEDVVITVALDPAAGCVMADPGQIEQVILNLAVNARDAMAHGGTFTIATGIVLLDVARAGSADLPPGAYVSLIASDTGCGMNTEVLDHI
ncbi:MAG: PAS domain S-box protein, partial [Gemmatimonadaceae bacterium]|nr:PAS domain S-box protein [Gemmatimonadaceae bacterium]